MDYFRLGFKPALFSVVTFFQLRTGPGSADPGTSTTRRRTTAATLPTRFRCSATATGTRATGLNRIDLLNVTNAPEMFQMLKGAAASKTICSLN